MTLPTEVTPNDVERAAALLQSLVHRTPVMTSRQVNERTGAEVFFKCENFQKSGSFKFRGASNALRQLTPAQREHGVVSFSSGNHAQAMALAGRMLGVPVTIVMPDDAPVVKVNATRGYGAEVIVYDRARQSREEIAAQVQQERGLTLIPPFDHPHVIAGQGTLAVELIEEVGHLDALFVCVGGGGLISGCALAVSQRSPGCSVIGVEPQAGDDATRSFKTGVLHSVHNPHTIADGARTTSLGSYTFPLVRRYVHDMMTVSDSELLEAVFYLMERMKMVVEPTGVLGAAGLLSGRAGDFQGKRVGVVISGGNVDIRAICAATHHA